VQLFLIYRNLYIPWYDCWRIAIKRTNITAVNVASSSSQNFCSVQKCFNNSAHILTINCTGYYFLQHRIYNVLLHVRVSVSDIRLLFRTLPWRHFHHPHDASQSVLHYQPHLSLPPHLRRLLPWFLLASRVRRKSQSRNHNFAGARRLSADSWWDIATNAWCHPSSRSVAVTLTARNVARHRFTLSSLSRLHRSRHFTNQCDQSTCTRHLGS